MQIYKLDVLHAEHVDFAVPAAAGKHSLVKERPSASDDEFGVCIVDVHDLWHTGSSGGVPS